MNHVEIFWAWSAKTWMAKVYDAQGNTLDQFDAAYAHTQSDLIDMELASHDMPIHVYTKDSRLKQVIAPRKVAA